jgi:adenylate cyclase
VIARNTTFTYKGKSVDVKQVGRELGIRYVLEGSVRRAGDQVRVNVQLIDAESGAHVWADRFDTDRRDIVEAQSEITGRLAWALNMELVKDAGRRIEQEKAVDLDARDLVMRGWGSYFRPASSANRHDAQRFFEGALELDPRSIDARVGLAKILITNLVQGWSSLFQQNSASAERLLLEALERDTSLAKAHATMGQLRRVQNRLTESRSEYEAAIALDPNDDNAYGQLGWTLLFLGQPSAGLAQGEKALQLSPRDPHIWGTYLQLGWCRLLMSQVDPAADLLIHSPTANPRLWVTHFALAAALGLKGDLDGAGTVLVDLVKIKPEVNSLARFRTYRPWGNRQYWELFENTAAAGLRRVGFPDQ